MRIEARFNGPPDSAHGGIACGVFAAAVDPMQATVRLMAPPPLEADLQLRSEQDGSQTILDTDNREVASVRPWDPPDDFEPISSVSFDQLQAARDHFISVIGPDGSNHAFPTCFGCGPARPDNDGLALFTGKIPDTSLYGAEWVPRGIGGETVEPWMVWAAMDCPSGAGPFNEWVDYASGEIQLLGELSVSISELPVAGAVHQVLSRTIKRSGQRMISEVVVLAEGGANIARGRATWIHLSPSADH